MGMNKPKEISRAIWSTHVTFWKLKRQQIMEASKYFFLCITVALAYYIWGVCNALLAPFFPMEAESKGASTSYSGFVFGVYSLAAFIFSPIFGKYGVKISPKYIYIIGALTQS